MPRKVSSQKRSKRFSRCSRQRSKGCKSKKKTCSYRKNRSPKCQPRKKSSKRKSSKRKKKTSSLLTEDSLDLSLKKTLCAISKPDLNGDCIEECIRDGTRCVPDTDCKKHIFSKGEKSISFSSKSPSCNFKIEICEMTLIGDYKGAIRWSPMTGKLVLCLGPVIQTIRQKDGGVMTYNLSRTPLLATFVKQSIADNLMKYYEEKGVELQKERVAELCYKHSGFITQGKLSYADVYALPQASVSLTHEEVNELNIFLEHHGKTLTDLAHPPTAEQGALVLGPDFFFGEEGKNDYDACLTKKATKTKEHNFFNDITDECCESDGNFDKTCLKLFSSSKSCEHRNALPKKLDKTLAPIDTFVPSVRSAFYSVYAAFHNMNMSMIKVSKQVKDKLKINSGDSQISAKTFYDAVSVIAKQKNMSSTNELYDEIMKSLFLMQIRLEAIKQSYPDLEMSKRFVTDFIAIIGISMGEIHQGNTAPDQLQEISQNFEATRRSLGRIKTEKINNEEEMIDFITNLFRHLMYRSLLALHLQSKIDRKLFSIDSTDNSEDDVDIHTYGYHLCMNDFQSSIIAKTLKSCLFSNKEDHLCFKDEFITKDFYGPRCIYILKNSDCLDMKVRRTIECGACAEGDCCLPAIDYSHSESGSPVRDSNPWRPPREMRGGVSAVPARRESSARPRAPVSAAGALPPPPVGRAPSTGPGAPVRPAGEAPPPPVRRRAPPVGGAPVRLPAVALPPPPVGGALPVEGGAGPVKQEGDGRGYLGRFKDGIETVLNMVKE